MARVTMVIPTYNDLESLNKLIQLIDDEQTKEIDYLIVNNGSTVKGIKETLSVPSDYWTAIHLENNLGFGGGILEGIKAAHTDWIGWMPGNLKILPKDVDSLIRSIRFRPNLLIKCHRRRKSIVARIKTFIAGLMQSLLTGKSLFDTGGTPTICERSFVLKLKDLPTDYILESRMLFEARLNNLVVERPLIPYGERIYGQSHWQRGLRSEARLMRAIIVDSFQSHKRIRKK
jgi:polyisoprenyl-phosphate glycosyltransferase